MCASFAHLRRLAGAAFALLLLSSAVHAVKPSFRKAFLQADHKTSPHDAFAAPPVQPGVTPAWVDNPLAEYFFTYTKGPVIWKWHHYFDVYHRHLQHFRGRPEINMLVIGVQSGGEIGMWQNYFGPGLKFTGVDINPACKKLEKVYKNVTILTGDQGDANYLSAGLNAAVPGPVDIFIDDGSHINAHQILTFDTVFWKLNPNEGIYITEDTTTSYSAEGTAHRKAYEETFVQHMQKGIDSLYGWYVNPENPGDFTKNCDQMHFYDGMVVTARHFHPKPEQEQRGDVWIDYCTPGQGNGCTLLQMQNATGTISDVVLEKKNFKESASLERALLAGKVDKRRAELTGTKLDWSPHKAFESSGKVPDWVGDNPLAQYFFNYKKGPVIWKWHHYFPVYHRHLQQFRNRPEINMLVIGVQSGGEIGMWRDYFGPGLKFFGVDINPACKTLEKTYPGITIMTGDQGDANFMNGPLKQTVPQPVHIIIDDGSHFSKHQISTFDNLFWMLDPNEGVYIIEDTATSYSDPNSVFRRDSPETFIQHMRGGVDSLNQYYTLQAGQAPGYFTQNANQLHFYDSMVVAPRRPHPWPAQEQKGTDLIPYCTDGQANGCLT